MEKTFLGTNSPAYSAEATRKQVVSGWHQLPVEAALDDDVLLFLVGHLGHHGLQLLNMK
jgi:hypothetical protein